MCHEFEDRNAWRIAIEAALRSAIALDLQADDAAGPFVLFTDEVGSSMPDYAVTGASLWMVFHRDHPRLGDRSGPLLLLNWQAIAEDFGNVFHAATALAVHELAHQFDFINLRGAPVGDAEREAMVRETILKNMGVSDESTADHNKMPELGMCEMRFARRIIHIANRLIDMGWCVPLAHAYPWPCGFWLFVAAIDQELLSFNSLPLRLVNMNPVPEQFVELWNTIQNQPVVEEQTDEP